MATIEALIILLATKLLRIININYMMLKQAFRYFFYVKSKYCKLRHYNLTLNLL